MKIKVISVLVVALLLGATAVFFWWQRSTAQAAGLDVELQAVIAQKGLTPLVAPDPPDPALVALGQALFLTRNSAATAIPLVLPATIRSWQQVTNYCFL
ncbi:MAG: hypothetical protein HC804_03090 [Anaerolineae bacterium]|nr:hypothetical protein [Anaerolineae bacterium]